MIAQTRDFGKDASGSTPRVGGGVPNCAMKSRRCPSFNGMIRKLALKTREKLAFILVTRLCMLPYAPAWLAAVY